MFLQNRPGLSRLLANQKGARFGVGGISIAAVQRQFDVSRIDTISAKDIKFTEGKNGREANANYEKRVPLIANIDVVVKFDKLVYKLSSAD
jgi:hypothetical protein